MHAPSRPAFPLGALLVLPGTAFWVLVIVGTTKDGGRQAGAYVGAAVALGVVTGIVFAVLKVRQLRARKARRARALTSGARTTARIVGTRVRGHLNHDPYVVFDLEVSAPRGGDFRIEVVELVSQLAVPRIQPESVLEVWIHPDDPRYVVIDPSELGRG